VRLPAVSGKRVRLPDLTVTRLPLWVSPPREIAQEADVGFDRRHFAAMLGLIGRLDDLDDFAVYGATPEYLAGLRLRVADWRTYLTKD
jgi:hypothetical protein